jgi:hypothetical protein
MLYRLAFSGLYRVRYDLVASIPRLPGYGQGRNNGWRLKPRLNDLAALGHKAHLRGLPDYV